MSAASFAAGWAPPTVVIVDRSASVVEAIAGRLGDGSVRVLGARTALEAIRHIQHEPPPTSVLIGSPAGDPSGDVLARYLLQKFPSVAVDRLGLVPIRGARLD